MREESLQPATIVGEAERVRERLQPSCHLEPIEENKWSGKRVWLRFGSEVPRWEEEHWEVRLQERLGRDDDSLCAGLRRRAPGFDLRSEVRWLLPPSFTQLADSFRRLLLANDQAIFGISDLWVAQATQADDQFSQVDYDESVFEDDESRLDIDADESEHEPDFFGFGTAPPSLEDLRGQAAQQDELRGQYGDAPRGSPSLNVPRNRSESKRSPSRDRVTSYGGRHRRDSVVSSRGPALFANTGLNPQSLGSAAALLSPPIKDAPEESAFNPMTAIPEMRPASIIEHDVHADVENLEQKVPVPLLRQLPLAMIGQYALLALHGTVCDQVRAHPRVATVPKLTTIPCRSSCASNAASRRLSMLTTLSCRSFIVTPVPSGGLGLKAANYALLVSLMFFFSMYVLRLRRKLSH